MLLSKVRATQELETERTGETGRGTAANTEREEGATRRGAAGDIVVAAAAKRRCAVRDDLQTRRVKVAELVHPRITGGAPRTKRHERWTYSAS